MAERADNGVIHAYGFDAEGRAEALPPMAIGEPPEIGFDWIHVRHRPTDLRSWLIDMSGVPSEELGVLAGGNDRPRCLVSETDDTLIILRGVNLLRGAVPEHMLPLIFHVTAHRIITVEYEALAAVRDVTASLARNHLFRTTGELLTELAMRLIERMDVVINELSDRADDLEEGVWTPDLPARFGNQVAALRRLALTLRRTLTPQREALNRLAIEDPAWLSHRDRMRLREAADKVIRMTDELDSVRERVAVVHDQLIDRRAEKLNRTMLVLAKVTTLFAPLSLVAGLFGMNVGGIPFFDAPSGFFVVLLLTAGIGASVVILFRQAGWL
ncbi:MAG: zinc transporter ZntB [Hyphomicrobiaceae bacterium]|nr:zinc transporter ZntB [Hyphomicrobiaceae bacterium]